MKIYLSQLNPTVGDLNGNCAKILSEFKAANDAGCDLAVFPEMAICGYPCEDLWHKPHFISAVKNKIFEILEASRNFKCAILLGSPSTSINRAKKEVTHNSAFLIEEGEVKKIINKKTLPNFSVFDEQRYFESSSTLSVIEFRGLTLAILICEDLWDSKNLFLLNEQVVDAVVTINASPYSTQKTAARHKVAENFAKTLGKPVIYVNQVGGQDSLVFDGSSFVLDGEGESVLRLKEFEEDYGIVEFEKSGPRREDGVTKLEVRTLNSKLVTPSSLRGQVHELKSDYSAATLALRDYLRKNGFKKVLLGMSGGIDSALVATIAVDALGSENVAIYALPSRFNSETSMIDAQTCAKNLGLDLKVISIESTFEAMLATLGEISQLAKENLQSRIRGNILMALSNDLGALLLSTGNKSELACGYSTLYGDTCGAFNPLKDFYKTRIYELANWRNENVPEISLYTHTNLIPQNILTKAPTAELRPNQKDSDSLPEYEILDQILFSLIEEQKSVAEIIKSGFEEGLVKKVAKLLHTSEYKRRQSCLGPKISEMAFDKDRRYPITNKFTF